mgnify:CR=1 FL=1
MKAARIGYIRVSSADQNLARQEEALTGILHEWTNLRQMVTLYDFVFKPLILEKSLYKQT